ncbi:MAG: glycoside hydrolase family 97 N-terminal domain-containing protein, partial [Muribaculaceae bacterium]|nr:glycoside hydrolase family 97 N-terminal domain-containing protein [Muribaculaceae bacterium]
MKHILALLLAACSIHGLTAGESITSPDGRIKVEIDCDTKGRPYYTVTKNGDTIIAPSRLGFKLKGAKNLDRGFKITGTERAGRNDSWETVWGEEKTIVDKHNCMTVQLKQGGRTM